MISGDTLILTRRDVAELLDIEDCITAVEGAFRAYGEGTVQPPGILGVHAENGGFHIKAGIMNVDRPYFVAKVNANFPANRDAGRPTIQGVMIVADARDGTTLAVLDSIEITILRTGAATAVAAKYLARDDARTALICGCGDQGRVSLSALLCVRPIETVFVSDIDAARARRFAQSMSGKFGIEVVAVDSLIEAARQSDIIVTCTTSRQPFLLREHVSPGTFVAAVGADSEDKQELEPELLKGNKVVVDISDQCLKIGELHHAVNAGLVSADDVYAELGQIVAGRRPGRTSLDEIIIFDSTGMALQDVAAAAIVYSRASGGQTSYARLGINR